MNYEDIINDCTKIIENNVNLQSRAKAYFKRGTVYRELKKYDESTFDFERAVVDFTKVISDSNNTQIKAKAYYKRGVVYRELKQFYESISDLIMAIEHDRRLKISIIVGNVDGVVKYKKAIHKLERVSVLDIDDKSMELLSKVKEDIFQLENEAIDNNNKAITNENKRIEEEIQAEFIKEKKKSIFINFKVLMIIIGIIGLVLGITVKSIIIAIVGLVALSLASGFGMIIVGFFGFIAGITVIQSIGFALVGFIIFLIGCVILFAKSVSH